jgi:hypothetical protein
MYHIKLHIDEKLKQVISELSTSIRLTRKQQLVMYHIKLHIDEKLKQVISELSTSIRLTRKQQLVVTLHLRRNHIIMQHFLFIIRLVMPHFSHTHLELERNNSCPVEYKMGRN